MDERNDVSRYEKAERMVEGTDLSPKEVLKWSSKFGISLDEITVSTPEDNYVDGNEFHHTVDELMNNKEDCDWIDKNIENIANIFLDYTPIISIKESDSDIFGYLLRSNDNVSEYRFVYLVVARYDSDLEQGEEYYSVLESELESIDVQVENVIPFPKENTMHFIVTI